MGSAEVCRSELTGAVFCDAGKGAGGHVLDQGEVGRETLIARRLSVYCPAPPSGRYQAFSVPSARRRKGWGGCSGAGSNVLVVIVVDVWVRHCGSRRSRGRGLEIQVEERVGGIILLSWLAVAVGGGISRAGGGGFSVLMVTQRRRLFAGTMLPNQHCRQESRADQGQMSSTTLSSSRRQSVGRRNRRASLGGGLFGEVRQWVNPRSLFFRLPVVGSSSKPKNWLGGAGQGQHPRGPLASAHKQAPVGSPTTELKAVPPRPALPRPPVPGSKLQWYRYIYLVSSETRQGSFWRQLS